MTQPVSMRRDIYVSIVAATYHDLNQVSVEWPLFRIQLTISRLVIEYQHSRLLPAVHLHDPPGVLCS